MSIPVITTINHSPQPILHDKCNAIWMQKYPEMQKYPNLSLHIFIIHHSMWHLTMTMYNHSVQQNPKTLEVKSVTMMVMMTMMTMMTMIIMTMMTVLIMTMMSTMMMMTILFQTLLLLWPRLASLLPQSLGRHAPFTSLSSSISPSSPSSPSLSSLPSLSSMLANVDEQACRSAASPLISLQASKPQKHCLH